MEASAKAGKPKIFISKEMRELAEKACALYRADKLKALNKSKLRPMKEYHIQALKKAGLEVTSERLSQMGAASGSKGGKKTAELLRAGIIDRSNPSPVEARQPRSPRPMKQLMLLAVSPTYR